MFSSISFLYLFLPLCLFFYYITPKYKNWILFIFSLIFYSIDGVFTLILLSIVLAYINGLLIEKYNKKIFILAIFLTLIPLFYFKYTNFFINNINILLKTNIKIKEIMLPLGISFFTFQIISYLADVKKYKKAEHNFLNLALYICFFPQLVAGPIVKYANIKEQIKNRKTSINQVSEGVLYFLLGLCKKVLIANQLSEIWKLYNPNNTTIVFTWIYGISYTMYVYFDFSGYSNMAIGLGKMFGFELPLNFNYPLIANSIKDFWKRWHITLSSFFKEYVYIPLGGSRYGKIKTIRNLFIVWFLTGFWHGANWTFIFWGLYFFILLVIEKFIIKDRLNKNIQRLFTLFLVIISFILFGANSLSEFTLTIKNLFTGLIINKETIFIIKNYGFIILISMIFSTPICKIIYQKIKDKKISIILEPIFIIISLLLCTSYLVNGSFNPFLYFIF